MNDLHDYNPDVLSCLANLSNDEVFTPPHVANAMIDMLPQELFSDPTTTFLDPCTKSGVFLREIVKRLLNGLKDQIPDLQIRLDHILHKQVFGIAITEMTSLLARRSIYCSKYPNSKYSISLFNDVQGNIRFKNTQHTWKNNKCVWCGASETEYGAAKRSSDLETHAYEFIHTNKLEDIFGMKFDVIIGNPPYQMTDGGNGVSAAPIFQHFVEQAKKLNPRYLSMIIPARWYAGGKGLDTFRSSMLNDDHLQKIVDYESSKECFDGVNIAGGICYFLWNRNYHGLCEMTNVSGGGGKKVTAKRSLNEYPILIRSNLAISIVHKVLNTGVKVLSDYAYPRNPFNFQTNFRGHEKCEPGDIEILTSKGFSWIRRTDVKKNTDIIDYYKVLIGRLVPNNGELDTDPRQGYKVITDTRLIGPGQINTETYLDIGVFPTKLEACNFEKFLNGKFSRFLLKQAISSLNVTRNCFRFVPFEDFHEEWTDEKLYQKYNLTNDEIALIEATIRARD